MSDNKVKISYSSITRFKACPRKYWLSKNFKDKNTSSALCFGKALEFGIDVLLKKGTLEDAKHAFSMRWMVLPEDEYSPPFGVFDNPEVVYYASDLDTGVLAMQRDMANEWCQELVNFNDFEKVCDGLKGERLSESEQRLMNRLSWLCLQIKGHLMLEAFNDEILANVIEVIDVQRPISMISDEGDEKMGYVDLIARYKGYDKPIVFDLKTAGAPYSLHKLDTSEQLMGYSVALEEELKSNLIGYLVLLKKPESKRACAQCGEVPTSAFIKKCKSCNASDFSKIYKCKTQVLIKEAVDSNLNDIVKDDGQIVKAIKAGVDYKNPESCMMFGKRCEFYDVCWNNKKPEDLDNLTCRGEKK